MCSLTSDFYKRFKSSRFRFIATEFQVNEKGILDRRQNTIIMELG
jgi:hypothetical protein